jgi:hypothetical protein
MADVIAAERCDIDWPNSPRSTLTFHPNARMARACRGPAASAPGLPMRHARLRWLFASTACALGVDLAIACLTRAKLLDADRGRSSGPLASRARSCSTRTVDVRAAACRVVRENRACHRTRPARRGLAAVRRRARIRHGTRMCHPTGRGHWPHLDAIETALAQIALKPR